MHLQTSTAMLCQDHHTELLNERPGHASRPGHVSRPGHASRSGRASRPGQGRTFSAILKYRIALKVCPCVIQGGTGTSQAAPLHDRYLYNI